jgi:hypothetical protein
VSLAVALIHEPRLLILDGNHTYVDIFIYQLSHQNIRVLNEFTPEWMCLCPSLSAVLIFLARACWLARGFSSIYILFFSLFRWTLQSQPSVLILCCAFGVWTRFIFIYQIALSAHILFSSMVHCSLSLGYHCNSIVLSLFYIYIYIYIMYVSICEFSSTTVFGITLSNLRAWEFLSVRLFQEHHWSLTFLYTRSYLRKGGK